MPLSYIALVIIVLTIIGFWLGRSRAMGQAGGKSINLHSLPSYYGFYVAIWCAVPALIVMAVWSSFEGAIVENIVLGAMPQDYQEYTDAKLGLLINDIRNLAAGGIASSGSDNPAVQAAVAHYQSLHGTSDLALTVVALALAIACLSWARTKIAPRMRARNKVEAALKVLLIICSTIAILTTFGIVMSLLFESMRFFGKVPFTEFLFGTEWSPQTALRSDQVGSSGAFGAIPLFAGTLLISFIAMCVAAPIGLLAAIFMSEYANPKVRAWVKPILEILAGVPTVVYGFFAALTVAPFLRNLGVDIDYMIEFVVAGAEFSISSESALAAGLVMGIMIIPFVSSLSDDVISAVPQSLREGSFGLGATRSETIRNVVFPAALPGIVGGLLLAVSRAIGETMIVVMAAGLAANLTANPFQAVTTVTVQIVTLLVGDQEFDSAKTLAAFALGLVLFCITLCLNVFALHVVNKYREQYD
ncbi:MAG: phosphate ABC transporter permease subunit PstC [Magnetovibrionaceae bacterium]